MTPYWNYLHLVVYLSAGIGVCRYLPLPIVRLVAGLTHNEQRHRQCMEVLRLARKDAFAIPPYSPAPSRPSANSPQLK
jgi:hypothetical protein